MVDAVLLIGLALVDYWRFCENWKGHQGSNKKERSFHFVLPNSGATKNGVAASPKHLTSPASGVVNSSLNFGDGLVNQLNSADSMTAFVIRGLL